MEEHRIKVKIADRVYSQTVSQDKEAAIRKAAASVDEVIREYSRSYPEVSQIDIATIVALNAVIESASVKERLEKLESEVNRLSSDLKKYVDSLK